MAHFRILIPNSRAPAADELKRVGLGGLLRADDWSPSAAQLPRGPKGISGLCVSWDYNPGRPGAESPRYEFDEQRDTAIEAPADASEHLPGGRFWLLLENARPVTATDLKRKPLDDFKNAIADSNDPPHIRAAKTERLKALTRFEGNEITLGTPPLSASSVYTIPNQFRLPAVMQLTESGTWGEYVQPKFRSTLERMVDVFNACQQHILWQLVRDHAPDELDGVLSDDDREFLTRVKPQALDEQIAAAYLCDILALNYRVTPWIVSALGLLTPEKFWPCLLATTDESVLRALWETVQKKIDAIQRRGLNSALGAAA